MCFIGIILIKLLFVDFLNRNYCFDSNRFSYPVSGRLIFLFASLFRVMIFCCWESEVFWSVEKKTSNLGKNLGNNSVWKIRSSRYSAAGKIKT